MKPTLEEQLAHAAARNELSEAERARVWARIEKEISHTSQGASVSPYTLLTTKFFSRHMIGALIALVILVGGGATVAASDDARPGDALFPVDSAVERVRLAFAGDDREANLRIRFAEERVAEVDSLINDSRGRRSNDDSSSVNDRGLTEAEADVFTNETVVKVEINGRHEVFTTSATARAEIVSEIAVRYELVEADVDAILELEVEDRASRADDKDSANDDDDDSANDDISDDDAARISHGLNIAIASIEETLVRFEEREDFAAQAALEAVIEKLNLRLDGLADDRIRIDVRSSTSGRSTVEIRSSANDGSATTDDSDNRVRIDTRSNDLGRVRLEYRDGKLEIRSEGDLDESTTDLIRDLGNIGGDTRIKIEDDKVEIRIEDKDDDDSDDSDDDDDDDRGRDDD